MKRLALAAFLFACLMLHARPAAAASEQFYISTDRQTVILNGVSHVLPQDGPREAYFKVKNGGIAAMYLKSDGSPGVPDYGNSYMVADSFGCGFQCLTFDSSNNLDVNVITGTITLGSGTNTLGSVSIVPVSQTYGTKTELVVAADFAVNSATCTAVAAYPNSGAANTGHYCWIIKGTAGLLYKITWMSSSNMNTLVASSLVTCYDNATTNSGNIVFIGSMSAGQYMMAPAAGQPFTNGLTCTANHALGTANVDTFYVELK